MFAIRGKLDGRSIVMAWDDGVLSGDEVAVSVAELQAETSEGEGSISGYFRVGKEDILSCDVATFLMLSNLLDDVELVSGDLSPPIPVPEGATT